MQSSLRRLATQVNRQYALEFTRQLRNPAAPPAWRPNQFDFIYRPAGQGDFHFALNKWWGPNWRLWLGLICNLSAWTGFSAQILLSEWSLACRDFKGQLKEEWQPYCCSWKEMFLGAAKEA